MNPEPGIDPFSLEALEFPAVIDLVGRFVSGPLGSVALGGIAPSADAQAIRRSLDAAREARDYLIENSRPGLGHLADLAATLEALEIEGVAVTAPEILGAIDVARAASSHRDLFTRTGFAALQSIAENLPDLRDLVGALGGKILPDGALDSSASPALARIRKSIEQTRRELDSRLATVARRLGRDEVLQDELVTIRNGRYVLPVKLEKKRHVEGVVHGASSSGQSVFVEPLETLPLNNELVELGDRELAEVERLLGEFTEMLRERRHELRDAAARLGELDLAFAKAEFARHYGASIPEVSAGRELILRDARHPLLVETLRRSGRDAVPLTLELREPQSILIISGPNTGGKSVALKTVGTAVLMAQAGLPVLASEARLPLFGRVLVDAGDQQSIAQNLSTFSAHVRNIQSMLDVAGRDTLALLDEVGSSTDPEEGAALAVAILESFLSRGSRVMVSTHHARLKAYAAATPAALNASMDFDEVTLRPTYKFLPGLPGKSSGLDIAERLGLDAEVVSRARALIDPRQSQAAALISGLHAKALELEAAITEVQRQKRELHEREAQLEKESATERREKLRELDRRLEATLREYSEKWSRALEQIRERALSESKSAKALTGANRRGEALARHAREEWNSQVLESLHPSQTAEPTAEGVPAQIGDRVRLPGIAEPGRVTALLDGEEIEVEVGRVRMRTQRELAQVLGPKGDATRSAAPRGSAAPETLGEPEHPTTFELGTPVQEGELLSELNVIGSTADEARDRVDEFLDRAFLSGKVRVRIVHGYGKGILRKALHEMLGAHPHVARFYPAPKGEGGEGATIAELRQ